MAARGWSGVGSCGRRPWFLGRREGKGRTQTGSSVATGFGDSLEMALGWGWGSLGNPALQGGEVQCTVAGGGCGGHTSSRWGSHLRMGRNQTLAGEPPGRCLEGRAGQRIPAWGPGETHVGVAGAVPPSLTQAVLAPDCWPGRVGVGRQNRCGAGGRLLDRGGPRPRPALFTEGPES